ncbi:hypothetical protein EVG20_g4489 [Dentipellis fragilis]|uniref:Isochorismatase-like domain-containing protein n=1 Tax=Dentipellis fragilis TaxID=205917 RepID=A0A4Y9YY52_9AGAM|nr:hypothetical protein EVG20_g4489 [Dentipellis fragilis]
MLTQTCPKHGRALLIVDAQVAMLADPPQGVPEAEAVKANIQCILAAARDATPPPPDRARWELVWPPLPGEPVIDKHKNNAFAGTRLAELIPNDAEIVVVGLQSDFCIRATCSAALGRGNEVLLIRGAHATYDRHEVWAGGGVTPASFIERDIESELEEAGVALLDMTDVPGVFDR